MEITTKPSSSLRLADPSETLEESVTALNQVLELNPENSEARQTLYETMQQILRKDAFLAYEGETDVIYRSAHLKNFNLFIQKTAPWQNCFRLKTPRLREQPFTGWDGLSLG